MDKYSYPIRVLTSEKNKLECVADNKPIGDSIGTLMGYIDELQQAIDILPREVIARFKGKVTYTSDGVKIGDKYVSDLIDKPLLNSMDNPEISISTNKMKG